MKNLNLLVSCLSAFLLVSPFSRAQNVDVICTTDVHGAIFDYDFVTDTTASASMSKVYSFVKAVRDSSDNVILLDNGDFLQGSPAVYYYNYIDTLSLHVTARIFNLMNYDAVNIGNHDIEATHNVYDKIVRQVNAPVLGANVIRKSNKQPYFKPYVVLERAGKRIVVLGLTTPYIPHWLPEVFWSGMEFNDMIESAQYWMDYIKKNENPDAVIGLFHSGFNYEYGNQNADTYKNENASVLVGQRVEGFDALLIGHDHRINNTKVTTPSGRQIPLLDAGFAARTVACLRLSWNADGKLNCDGRLVATANLKSSSEYDDALMPQFLTVKAFSRKVIGNVAQPVFACESLMGSSPFVDVVHSTMLRHTGADISFSAPLLINTVIPAGPFKVGRLFSLYRYENTLCVMRLSGREVKNYLEYSYNLWVANPKKNDGHVLLFERKGRLKNNYYNLDSAAGIVYTVDVTADYGSRVNIISMADGSKFDPDKSYRVAINSYRANGGGGHLEHGAGIPFDQIQSRIVSHDTRDLRRLIMQDFISQSESGASLDFKALGQWKFVPENVVSSPLKSDVNQFRGSGNAYFVK